MRDVDFTAHIIHTVQCAECHKFFTLTVTYILSILQKKFFACGGLEISVLTSPHQNAIPFWSGPQAPIAPSNPYQLYLVGVGVGVGTWWSVVVVVGWWWWLDVTVS